MAADYTSTLNLPKTEFSMRANLPQREPEMLKVDEAIGIYEKLIEKNAGKESFVLHDGPPFSNGNIHMGHALNKILKDFIIKYKAMTGHCTPYVPGWDNHGMPIESAIIKKNKLDRKKMSIPEFRSACHAFAQNFVDLQLADFKRLGVIGDWEHPYLTMSPEMEAEEVRVFGKMYENGYIYKGLKPVYWCPKDETALAEAEIEYRDDECVSIYVKFRLADDKGVLEGVDKENTYFIIWTTTAWTLPGNLAIAVHPRESYVVAKADNGESYIVAEALLDKTMKAGGIENYEIVKVLRGSDLELMEAEHPFLDRRSILCNADYVTMDSGTGCVHTAPGFGADDYRTCKAYNIDIIVPVDDRGYQTEDSGKYAGMYYAESGDAILADMQESGALFASEKITHSYPHCWRCKSPIIFRATPQWFCSVADFRDATVKACESVEWLPAWGGERIVQMVRERADWCISRQRHWGLPIPVFYCSDCKKPVCTPETIAKVADIFGECGSNAWFEKSEAELLPEGFVCPHCGGVHFYKETDTLDGWFDSGSTHFTVLDREHHSYPADLYLEGADQYRGWFQSSLLSAIGAGKECAPFKQVLTHGWVVDGEGKAMHKSLGNSVSPLELIQKYGADLVRLWVASSDYRVDVRVSDAIFKQLSETYRKIRNTARILLANIGEDFDPNKDIVPVADMLPLDKWAVCRANRLVKACREAYELYEFHSVYREINNFCTVDISKLYVDITKDRMYCEAKDSAARRSGQSAMYYILDTMTRLLAPILAFTSNEIWSAMKHKAEDAAEHVLLTDMPVYDAAIEAYAEVEEKYEQLFKLRDEVMKALEVARADKLIGKSLEAKITVYTEDNEAYSVLEGFDADELKNVFIVSACSIVKGGCADAFCEEGAKLAVKVEPADGVKCDRCWMFSVESYEDGEGHLCPRCRATLNK
ncbi:MAG: isoleucine--tRNA ligase [Ruminococcaceae bacterium]|nr:isoleucine--tRNA ligase [Oscillospiraceae bacterium]